MMKKIARFLLMAAFLPIFIVLGVTPKNGTLFFYAPGSKRTYVKNIYISDVAAAPVTFAPDGGVAAAGQDTFWIPPEDVDLIDVSLIAGPTVIFNLQTLVNSLPTGDVLDYASQLNSLATRPSLRIGTIRAGSKFAVVQR